MELYKNFRRITAMYTTQNKTRLVPHPTFEDVVAQSRFFAQNLQK